MPFDPYALGIKKNRFTPAATVHDMVPSVRVFDAEWSGHGDFLNEREIRVNARLDPYVCLIQSMKREFQASGRSHRHAVREEGHGLSYARNAQIHSLLPCSEDFL